MKLKHLFLTVLVAGTFASCSDDDSLSEPVYQQIETSFSLSTTSNAGLVGKAATKVDETTTPGADSERKIHTLTAVVFYEDGTLATTRTVNEPVQDENFNTSIDNIIVKVAAVEAGLISETELKVFLLANVSVPQSALVNYETFIKSSFTGITNCSFDKVMSNGGTENDRQFIPMSSNELAVSNLIAGTAYNNQVESSGGTPVYTSNTEGTKGKKLEKDATGKYVPGTSDYTPSSRIALTRYVARVQLESLEADFNDNYKDATFTLKSVSVANVSNASRFVENEGSFQSVDYSNDQAFYRGFPEKIKRADYYLARSTYDKAAFSKDYSSEVLEISGSDKIDFVDKTLSTQTEKPEMAQFYVFEFQNELVTADQEVELPSTASKTINTMLIITGQWKNGSIDDERSFRIPIRHDINSQNDYQVKRNYIYKVHATLTGEGTNNPDKSMLNAFITFQIKVEPWNIIKQDESDVN